MDVVAKIISKLIKNKSFIDNTNDYFTLTPELLRGILKETEDDLASTKDELVTCKIRSELDRLSNIKTLNYENQLVNRLSKAIQNAIDKYSNNQRNIRAAKIRDSMITNFKSVKSFYEFNYPEVSDIELEKIKTYATFNRLLKSKDKLALKDHSHFDVLEEYLSSKELVNHDKTTLNDVCRYFDSEINSPSFSQKEIDNLCGIYFSFKRTNYKENKTRLLSISTFEFFKNSNNTVSFKYLRKAKDGQIFFTEGNAIRSTPYSLMLIGFESKSFEKSSVIQINLSISVEDLGGKNRKYINGGVFEVEDDIETKPFHTFIHLSKINDITTFKQKLKNENFSSEFYSEIIIENGLETILYPINIVDFENFLLNEEIIKEQISNNKEGKKYPQYINYLKDKMYLLNDEINSD